MGSPPPQPSKPAAAARGVKPVTVRSTLTTFGMVVQSFVDQGTLPRNVIALVERRPRDAMNDDDADTEKSWTVAEVETFRESVRDERLFACWPLSCYGLRRSEVLGLRWSHLDGDVLRIRRGRVGGGRRVQGGEAEVPTRQSQPATAARSHRGAAGTQDQADLRRRESQPLTAVMLVGLTGFEPATT